MNKQDLKVNTVYNVKGEGITRAIIYKDSQNNIWYGHPTLMNDFECFTKEHQEKVLRNITSINRKIKIDK